MTTPTREQAVQWANQCGLAKGDYLLANPRARELLEYTSLARADLQAEIAVLQSALSSAVEQRDLLIAAAKRAIGDEWVYLTDLRDTVKAVEQQSEHHLTSVKGGA